MAKPEPASQPSGSFQLPYPETSDPVTKGGSLTVTVGSGQLTCNLAGGTNWKGLGSPPGSKGYKYVNKAAPSGDLCKIVIVKEKVIKVLAKGVGSIALPEDGPPEGPGNPDVSLALDVGSDSYCALAEAPHDKEKADTLIKIKDEAAPPECPAPCNCSAMTEYAFTTGIPAPGARAGTLREYRCSNDIDKACADDGDCTAPGVCQELVGTGLPMDLELGTVYIGGGLQAYLPFLVPDGGRFIMAVAGSSALSLSATTPGQVGQRNCTQGRTCDNNPALHCVLDADCGAGNCLDNCTFGPPLPIPASSVPPFSLCAVRVVDEDASGTAQCDGGRVDLTLPLRWALYPNGDLFGEFDLLDIPGIQPCPICDRLCLGSDPAERFPCDSDQDCIDAGNITNLTCASSTKCLGGPNDGDPCTPGTSDSTALDDPENAFPTSHDCGNDPLGDLTADIGGLRTELNVTTGSQTIDAVDLPGQNRVFCGYCRDVNTIGSGCFEGDPDRGGHGCPDSAQCNPSGGATLPGCGIAVPCDNDADCSAPYESCAQRSSGAFSKAAATRIEVTGSTDGQCMNDGQPHTASLVSFFCIPATFDDWLDSALDFPGPGVELVSGDAQFQSPSGAFLDATSTVLD